MRSWLRLSTVEDKALGRGARAHADCLVFDLSGTSPAEAERARANCVSFLRLSVNSRRYVMIHPLGSGLAEDDLIAIGPDLPEGIILAGTEDGADIQKLDALLSVQEASHGLEPERTSIVGHCDTANGVLSAGSFRNRSKRLVALGWSATALAKHLGATRVVDESRRLTDPLRHARASVRLGAAAAGVAAIDCGDAVPDENFVRQACSESQADGFTGMMTGDPLRIALINDAFPEALLQ